MGKVLRNFDLKFLKHVFFWYVGLENAIFCTWGLENAIYLYVGVSKMHFYVCVGLKTSFFLVCRI